MMGHQRGMRDLIIFVSYQKKFRVSTVMDSDTRYGLSLPNLTLKRLKSVYQEILIADTIGTDCVGYA